MVANEAVESAAAEAAPALQFTHSLLRRPGGGKGRKRQKVAGATAGDHPQPTPAADLSAGQTSVTGTADATHAHAVPDPATASTAQNAVGTPEAAPSLAEPAPATAAEQEQQTAAEHADSGQELPQAASQPAADITIASGPPETSAGPAAGPPFRQLTRLTFAATEAGQAQLLAQRTDVIMSYDILAVQPLSERVMQQVKLIAPPAVLGSLWKGIVGKYGCHGPVRAIHLQRIRLPTDNCILLLCRPACRCLWI
jgi:hypothetical protein